MKITLKKYSGCNTQTNIFTQNVPPNLLGVLTTYNGLYEGNNTYSTPPFSVTIQMDETDTFVTGWIIDIAGSYGVGTYPLSITGTDGNEYFVVIEVTDSCGIETYNLNCCNAYNIVWVNRDSFENYIFTGKNQVFEIESGDEITFKTSDLVRKFAEKKSIYRAIQIGSGKIPKSHSVKIESLRNSIQAWLYDEDAPIYIDFEERFTPIYLDFDSFTVLDTSEKVYEVNIRFLIAKELAIQSQ